jgi:REP element-mobilizing transposase RayT
MSTRSPASSALALPASPARSRGPQLRIHSPRTECVFLTICAATRDPIFGWITGDRFLPSRLGLLVREAWLNIPVYHPGSGLDVFCIMPDHFHAVLHLAPATRSSRRVLEGPAAWRGGIGTIVNQFKGSVTRSAAIEGIAVPQPLWQRGHFERGVQNADSLATIRHYVLHHALREAVRHGARSGSALRR